MPQNDDLLVVLSARAGVYRTLQNALGNEPSAELLEQLSSSVVQSIFLLFDTGEAAYQQALESLFALSCELLQGGTEALTTLEGRFTRLFVGPGATEGNPWESFYRNADRTIRQGVTLEVRKAYVEQGLIPQAYPRVSDDHIALELDFLAKLAERALQTWTHGDTARAHEALAASEAFLREHLTQWIHAFAAQLSQAKHGASFYQELAEVLESFIPLDLEVLAELRALERALDKAPCNTERAYRLANGEQAF